MAESTGVAPTIIGPLTTTFTAPSFCSVAFGQAVCDTCTSAYLAQTCTEGGVFSDAAECWPPASSGAPVPTPPFAGRGYYSPGLVCPAGYTSACSATAGSTSGWMVEYSMFTGETAVGCCPRGYTCAFGFGQTCQSNAGAFATVSVSTCSGNSPSDLPDLVLPFTTAATAITADASVYTITSYQIWAPMIELRWQSTDLPAPSTSNSIQTSTITPPLNSQSRTTSTASTTSTPISAISSAAQHSTGLSTGAKVTTGVVVPVIVLALIAFVSIFILRRRRASAAEASFDQAEHRVPQLGGRPLYEMEHRSQAHELGSHDYQGYSHELVGDTPEPQTRQLHELPEKMELRWPRGK